MGSTAGFRKAVELLFAVGKLSYANGNVPAAKRRLTCRGLLPAVGSDRACRSRPDTQAYQDAIRELADQQEKLLVAKLRYCTLPRYEIDLGPTTLDLSAQPQLASYVYHDSVRKKLVIRGQLTDAEQKALEQGAAPPLPPAALNALPTTQNPGALAVNRDELRDLLPTAAKIDKVVRSDRRRRTCRRRRSRSPAPCLRP